MEKKASSNDLTTHTRTILVQIPQSIPKENIQLTKLKDGYKLTATCKKSSQEKEGTIQSSYHYESEERYGVDLKDVKGEFNKDGIYEIKLTFEPK